jgi:hypothetical protein
MDREFWVRRFTRSAVAWEIGAIAAFCAAEIATPNHTILEFSWMPSRFYA